MNEDMELTHIIRMQNQLLHVYRLVRQLERTSIPSVTVYCFGNEVECRLSLCSQLFFDSSFKLPNRLSNNFQATSVIDELFVKLSQESPFSSSGIRNTLGNQESIFLTNVLFFCMACTCCISTNTSCKIYSLLKFGKHILNNSLAQLITSRYY